jgi:hypothetical protein
VLAKVYRDDAEQVFPVRLDLLIAAGVSIVVLSGGRVVYLTVNNRCLLSVGAKQLRCNQEFTYIKNAIAAIISPHAQSRSVAAADIDVTIARR